MEKIQLQKVVESSRYSLGRTGIVWDEGQDSSRTEYYAQQPHIIKTRFKRTGVVLFTPSKVLKTLPTLCSESLVLSTSKKRRISKLSNSLLTAPAREKAALSLIVSTTPSF
jgi:hypothetical protein